MKSCFVLISLLAVLGCSSADMQEADTAFLADISDPAFPAGVGPVVMIDEGHNNFHTAGGRYLAFAEALRRDGYTIRPYPGAFIIDSLKTGDILVISNALPPEGEDNADQTYLSAFAPEEVRAVVEWVKSGGALLLIADHMPFPSAAADMAQAFDFEFSNAYALDTIATGPIVFARHNRTLVDHPITAGRNDAERVDSVASFTGQAFRALVDVDTILILPSSIGNYVPEEGQEFDREKMTYDPVGGWLQGAVREYGAGRLAVFGEAAMFTAQTYEKIHKFGMNHPAAGQNLQFLRNLMRWLAGNGSVDE